MAVENDTIVALPPSETDRFLEDLRVTEGSAPTR